MRISFPAKAILKGITIANSPDASIISIQPFPFLPLFFFHFNHPFKPSSKKNPIKSQETNFNQKMKNQTK